MADQSALQAKATEVRDQLAKALKEYDRARCRLYYWRQVRERLKRKIEDETDGQMTFDSAVIGETGEEFHELTV